MYNSLLKKILIKILLQKQEIQELKKEIQNLRRQNRSNDESVTGQSMKAIGDNFGGLSVLFLLITGAFTNHSKLKSNEKQGVYLGMLLFGIPSLFKQFKSKTPPPGGPKVPQAPKVPQGPKVPSAR